MTTTDAVGGGVLAVLDAEIAKAGRANAHSQRYANLREARATIAALYAERDELAAAVSKLAQRESTGDSELIALAKKWADEIQAAIGFIAPDSQNGKRLFPLLDRIAGDVYGMIASAELHEQVNAAIIDGSWPHSDEYIARARGNFAALGAAP
jgi:hypothetical protein